MFKPFFLAIKNEADKNKEWQMKDRWNRYMNKYQNTVKKNSIKNKSMKKLHSLNPIENSNMQSLK